MMFLPALEIHQITHTQITASQFSLDKMTDLPTSLTYNIQPGVLAQVLGIAQCSGDDRLELRVWSNNDASLSTLAPNPKGNGWGSGFMSRSSGSTALTYGSTQQVRTLKFQVSGSTTKKDYDLQLKEVESRYAGPLNVTTITAAYQTWFSATIILVEFRSKLYLQSGKVREFQVPLFDCR